MGVAHVDFEFVERAYRTRSQAIAAHFVAAVGGFVEHDHSGSQASSLYRRGGSRRSGADHGDVDSLHISDVIDRGCEPHIGLAEDEAWMSTSAVADEVSTK